MEEASGPPVEVFPDNLTTVNVFIAMSTQWRTAGMDGVRTGLDYAALPGVLRLMSVKRSEWTEVFEGVRVMEEVALSKLREQNKRK